MAKKLHYQPSSPTIRLGNPTSTEPPISLGRGFAPYSGMSASKLLPTIMKAKMLVLLMLLLSISGIALLSSCGGDATEENHPTLSELQGTWHGTVQMKGSYWYHKSDGSIVSCFDDDYSVDVDLSISGSSYDYTLQVDAPYLTWKLAYASCTGEISKIDYSSGYDYGRGYLDCYVLSDSPKKAMALSVYDGALFSIYNFDNDSFDIAFDLWDRENILDNPGDTYGHAFGKLYRTGGSSSGSNSDDKSYTITSVKAVKFNFTSTSYSNYTTVNMYKWILHTQNNKVVLSTSNTDTSKWMVASKNTYKTLGNYNVSSYTYYVKHYVGSNSGYYYFFN
jgi:hypothetical protein